MPIAVEIINWKRKILLGLLVANIHPILYLGFDILGGKSLKASMTKYVLLLTFYLIVELFVALQMVFRGTTYKVICDDQGLTIKAFSKSKRLLWSQVATIEHSQQIDNKTLKNCLTLRDAGGAVQAQLWRDLQEPPFLKSQWALLEGFIASRLGSRAFTAPSLELIPTATMFTHQTVHKRLGLGSLVLWLPCAFFSWNHPTGGPLVGLGFLAFAALGVFLALCDARYQVDGRGVRVSTLFKTREMRWDEIRHAQMASAWVIYFEGDGKAVDIPGPANWSNGGELMLFLQTQFKKFGIEWGDKERNWRELLRSVNKIN